MDQARMIRAQVADRVTAVICALMGIACKKQPEAAQRTARLAYAITMAVHTIWATALTVSKVWRQRVQLMNKCRLSNYA